MKFSILSSDHVLNTLCHNNKKFNSFCHRIFKSIGEDFNQIEIENNIDHEIMVILAAKYFFMLNELGNIML